MPAYMSSGARTGARSFHYDRDDARPDHRRVIGKPRHEHGESGEKRDKNDLSQHLRSLQAVEARFRA